jgi:hypothetical protein
VATSIVLMISEPLERDRFLQMENKVMTGEFRALGWNSNVPVEIVG